MSSSFAFSFTRKYMIRFGFGLSIGLVKVRVTNLVHTECIQMLYQASIR